MQSAEAATQSVTLYYREGTSDKVYRAAIEPSGTGFVVNVAYGRRGSALQTGTKTPHPVDHADARRIYERLVREKTAKGYTPGEDGTPYRHTENQGRSAGVLPQLLNPVDEAEVERLVGDDAWWVQEKFDGRRVLVRKQGAEVVGINRSGLLVGLPLPVVEAVQGAVDCGSCLLDGEAVGEVYHAFDLLELDGRDLRPAAYAERYARTVDLADATVSNHVRYATTAANAWQKRALIDRLRRANREGVVFKRKDAPYTPGRPASGGTQLKLKFYATASCVVAAVNGRKRSVALELLDGGGSGRVGVGSVTIPPNHAVPRPGDVVEVRYLYAYPGGGGCLYQPVYLGRRDDVGLAACVVGQLKYRSGTGEDDADEG